MLLFADKLQFKFMTAGHFFFRYRSYTPIPFIIPLLLYARPTEMTMLVGFIFVVLGETLRFWGVCYAGSETRTTGKTGGTNLVTQGPFSYVRNPLYLGNMIIYFGYGIMAYSLFPVLQILGLLFFAVQYYFIVKEEEETLRNKFKEKYDDYFKSVGRFIPSLKTYTTEKQSKLKFNFKDGYKSEKRTLQGVLTVLIFIIVLYFLTHG